VQQDDSPIAPEPHQPPVPPTSRTGWIIPFRRMIGLMLGCYWGLLFVATHMPSPEVLVPPSISDKLLHFTAFLGLSVLFGLWQWASETRKPHSWLTGFAILTGYAAFDELMQSVPLLNRNPDVIDWLADVAGVICGLGLVWSVRSVVVKRRSRKIAGPGGHRPS